MVKVIGVYTVGLSDTLVTIKDSNGDLLKAQVVDAWNAVERWKETCERVSEAIKAKREKREHA